MNYASIAIVKETSENIWLQKEKNIENIFWNRKCDGAVITELCSFQHKYLLYLSWITLVHMHTPGRMCTLAFLCLSDSELLRSSSLPSDIFIFNWRVITFTRLHRGVLWKHLRERMHLPRQPHPLCLHLSSRIGAPQRLLALVARRPITSSVLLILQENGMFFPPPAKIHPRPSTEDCGISMYWRLAGGSYTFVILCSGLQREWKRVYYANRVLFC